MITGQKLENQHLEIDNKTFKDCVLVGCTLEYSGGDVAFLRTKVTECRYVFHCAESCALRALALIKVHTFHIQNWRETSEPIQ